MSAPPLPVSSDAWQDIRDTGRFLVDRLEEFERELIDDEVASQFFGHVSPALARFRDALDAQVSPPSTGT